MSLRIVEQSEFRSEVVSELALLRYAKSYHGLLGSVNRDVCSSKLFHTKGVGCLSSTIIVLRDNSLEALIVSAPSKCTSDDVARALTIIGTSEPPI